MLVAAGKHTDQQITELRQKMRSMEVSDDTADESRGQEIQGKEVEAVLWRSTNGAVRAVRKTMTEDEMIKMEESKGMEEDEERFTQEFVLAETEKPSVAHLGIDPARIKWRKPKSYNRVKTGYEWNKYNQVHYDLDSPPPKVVQGYKFNIFYPDLIDKTKAPTYKIQRTENPELVILHFIAGPPYLEVAFKIVNGEWEHSQKMGFKSMFSNGILHLYFNFKKYRYKR